MQSLGLKFSRATILQGVEFSVFLLILASALQQCSTTALPVISCTPFQGFGHVTWDSLGNWNSFSRMFFLLLPMTNMWDLNPSQFDMIMKFYISNFIYSWAVQCDALESLDKNGKQNQMHSRIKRVYRRRDKDGCAIKD